MTRRKIVFITENGERWISPEFNGDKDEFEAKRRIFYIGADTCNFNFDEILKKYFAGCSSALQFRHACFEALKNEYNSAYGFDTEAAKVHLVEVNEEIEADKVYTMDIPKWKMAYAEYIRDRQKKGLNSPTYQKWIDWCYDRLMEQHNSN